MFKKLNESIVQKFIQDLKQDKIFVELAQGKKYTIKGFKFHDNCLSILKQTAFKLYVNSDKNNFSETYAIKFDGIKHKKIASVTELYRIAKEKLDEPNYKDKIKKTKEQMVKELNSVEKSDWNPSWGVVVLHCR